MLKECKLEYCEIKQLHVLSTTEINLNFTKKLSNVAADFS